MKIVCGLTTERFLLRNDMMSSFQGHCPVRHAESERGTEGNGKPGQSTSDEAANTVRWL